MQVEVDTSDDRCDLCHGSTYVQKTVRHRVVTREHGAVIVHERVRVCTVQCRYPSGALVTQRSEMLASKVPLGAVHGYDLEVFIGLQRFVHHRQREEIRAMLAIQEGIHLSSGEVSHLARRFLGHLEELHRARAPEIKNALAQDRGYALHVDATGEDGRGTLFATYAGSRGWVLGAWKIATERAELVLPCLRETVALFGAPLAIMRDLGKAVTPAARDIVDELGLPIPILACHFHFLRDVGKDLLTKSYNELRELIRRFRLRPALRTLARDLGRRLRGQLADLRVKVTEWSETAEDHVLPDGHLGLATVRAFAQWALDYSTDARHGLPFDVPYLAFYQRCFQVRRAADAYLRRPPSDTKVRSALYRLARVLDPVVAEVPFTRIARTVSDRAALFGELRAALRLDEKPETQRPSPDQAVEELRDVHTAIDVLTQSLRDRRPERGPAQDTREAIDLVLDHLARHDDSLWGHVIQIPVAAGGGFRVIDRTNQRLEAFWHALKHGERRRSGRKVLTYDFEGLPAAAALAKNLAHADYVEVLCGTLEQMPHAFARLEAARRQQDRLRPPSGASRRKDATPNGPHAGSTDDTDDATGPAEAHETDPAESVVSASFPRDDRRLIRESRIRDRIATASRSRAPRCEPRRSGDNPVSPTRPSGFVNRVLTP